MIKGETKFWHEIKAFNIKNNCELSFTRVENSAAHGTPDLLVYNNSGHFFTIELKLISTKKIRFSQKALGPLSIKLYGGSQIEDLISGFAEPLSTGLENIFAFLKKI
jgi:hypothetical protein